MKQIYYIFIFVLSFGMSSCIFWGDDDSSSLDDLILVDEGIIEGTWSAALTIDSIVVIFENNRMIEYLYEKNTKTFISRTDLGKYYLYKKVDSSNWYKIKIYEYDEEGKEYPLYISCSYYEDIDELRIWNNIANKSIIYARIE